MDIVFTLNGICILVGFIDPTHVDFVSKVTSFRGDYDDCSLGKDCVICN
jgi:hypothetical protein